MAYYQGRWLARRSIRRNSAQAPRAQRPHPGAECHVPASNTRCRDRCWWRYTGFLQRYDLTKTPIAAVSKLRHYLDRQGQEIDRDEREQKMTSWDLLYNIMRANFDGGGDRAYCDVAPSGEDDGKAVYEVDCIVTSVQETASNEMEIAFHSHSDTKSTQTATADLIIAADGASSTTRNLFNSTPRKYACLLYTSPSPRD